jgi:hypothetical protein
MGITSQGLTLILILTIAVSGLSLFTVKPAKAQSTPQPSVPEFTLYLEGPNYIQNTTYSLDSNTGQIVAKIGYTNPYSYLEVHIKNQSPDNIYGNPYYNIRMKYHNSTNWVEAYSIFSGLDYPYPRQVNDSDFTDLGFSIEGTTVIGIVAGTQVDVQVEAIYGLVGPLNLTSNSPLSPHWGWMTDSTSDWSNTQTISVPANVPLSPTPTLSSSPTSTPPTTPTSTTANSSPSTSFLLITNIISLIVIAILLAVIIALLLYIKKQNSLLRRY